MIAVYGLREPGVAYPSIPFLESIAGLLGDLFDRWSFQEEHARLTPLEQQILDLLAKGRTTTDIASLLAIAEPSVKVRTEHARLKLQAPDVAAALALAVHRGGHTAQANHV